MDGQESQPDTGEARSDEQPKPADEPSKFFPFGTPCPGCGYTLTGCVPGSCPECGVVTVDLAHPGVIREITLEERERVALMAPDTGSWRALRYAVYGCLQTQNTVLGIIFLVGLISFVIIPILRLADRVVDLWQVVIDSAVRLVGLIVTLAVVQIGLSWWGHRSGVKKNVVAVAGDLEAGRVEVYHYEVTHAMRVEGREGEWLLLRIRGGFVLRVTAEGRKVICGEANLQVCERMRLAILPRSHWVVGLEFEGEPIDVPLREDLRPRYGLAEADQPIVGVDQVERVLITKHAAVPPFAPMAGTP